MNFYCEDHLLPFISPEKILQKTKPFPYTVYLNSNTATQLFHDPYSLFDYLIGFGSTKIEGTDVFSEQRKPEEWKFGYFGYDLKNQIERLKSENADTVQMEESFFFYPDFVVGSKNGSVFISGFNTKEEANAYFLEIAAQKIAKEKTNALTPQATISREKYIEKINNLKQHIKRGDIYEVNFCMEFRAEKVETDPYELYSKLNDLSPMPFSAFVKNKNQYVICASPERFLAKRKDKIISQPIKGTARRGENEREDEAIKIQLRNDKKEQSENVMIVDLVRNDLSKTAQKGSVVAEELFGIKTFRQLHQMVSTVVSRKKDTIDNLTVIKTCFPMGSMTGAPKVRAMQLIEKYEETKRGVYSGAIGYFDPNGDFDFNVVIRSILYNQENKVLSFMVGSAITINADAEKEYDECLLKAKAMMQILASS